MNDSEWQNALGSAWIHGASETFQYGANKWRVVEEQATALASEFGQFAIGVRGAGFTGAAAIAFSDVVTDSQKPLNDLPRVSADISRILENHATKLNEYSRAAKEALARAQTHWGDLSRTRNGRATSQARQNAIRGQIEGIRLTGDPTQQVYVTHLLEDHRRAERETQSRHQRVQAIKQRVSDDQRIYASLRTSETKLNEETANKLRHVDLRSLRDRNLLERIADGVGHFFVDLAQNIAEMTTALIKGDWNRFLWELRSVLDSVLVILAVVAFAAAIFATGGLAAGLIPAGLAAFAAAAGPVLAMATFGLAALKLVSTSALFLSHGVNSETGEKIGRSELLWDGVGVALSFFGMRSSIAIKGVTKGLAIKPVAWKANMAHNSEGTNLVRIFFKTTVGVDLYKVGKNAKAATNNFHFAGKAWTRAGTFKKVESTFDVVDTTFVKNPKRVEAATGLVTGVENPKHNDKRQEFILNEIRKTSDQRRSTDSPMQPRFIAVRPMMPYPVAVLPFAWPALKVRVLDPRLPYRINVMPTQSIAR
jgi:uncharacterized protein YukE